MSNIRRPLFGSSWRTDQIELFEEYRDLASILEIRFMDVEARYALMTWEALTVMLSHEDMADVEEHERADFVQLQTTALDIVCRRLLRDDSSSKTPPLYQRREDAQPLEPLPIVKELIDDIEYWLKDNRGLVNPDQLQRLQKALDVAVADIKEYKVAQRAYNRAQRGGARP